METNTYKHYGNQYLFKEYKIYIISEPDSAIIEFEDEYIGKSPLEYYINGIYSKYIKIKAIPSEPGQYTQTKVIRPNSNNPSNPFPRKIYFFMYLRQ